MRKLGLIILSGVIGFFSGTLIKYTWEANTFQPYGWGVEKPPIIVNCYGNDFSEKQMVRAISYWTLRGQHVALYIHNPSNKICSNEWLEGFIMIKKDTNMPEPNLAITKRYTSLNNMKAAVINYSPGAFNLALVNEHELGHAFGFSHVKETGHIMHPLLEKMGKGFWVP
tara:strand:+ start:12604 stop:13110 length:507 start_codon:yes stop_codon:yes gene_type:complete